MRSLELHLAGRTHAQYLALRLNRGLDELRRFHENIAEIFVGLRVDNESYHDYGDAVSVRVEFSGVARASGVPITGKVFSVYWLRDDAIFRVEDYTERVDVLKAVGLEG